MTVKAVQQSNERPILASTIRSGGPSMLAGPPPRLHDEGGTAMGFEDQPPAAPPGPPAPPAPRDAPPPPVDAGPPPPAPIPAGPPKRNRGLLAGVAALIVVIGTIGAKLAIGLLTATVIGGALGGLFGGPYEKLPRTSARGSTSASRPRSARASTASPTRRRPPSCSRSCRAASPASATPPSSSTCRSSRRS